MLYSYVIPNQKIIYGDIALPSYNCPLPDIIEEVRGILIGICDYKYPLPRRLRYIGGRLMLGRYDWSLPDSLLAVGNTVYCQYYKHPLPQNLKHICGSLHVTKYDFPIPKSLEVVGEHLLLQGHPHPIPDTLKHVLGYVSPNLYNHIIPERFTPWTVEAICGQ